MFNVMKRLLSHPMSVFMLVNILVVCWAMSGCTPEEVLYDLEEDRYDRVLISPETSEDDGYQFGTVAAPELTAGATVTRVRGPNTTDICIDTAPGWSPENCTDENWYIDASTDYPVVDTYVCSGVQKDSTVVNRGAPVYWASKTGGGESHAAECEEGVCVVEIDYEDATTYGEYDLIIGYLYLMEYPDLFSGSTPAPVVPGYPAADGAVQYWASLVLADFNLYSGNWLHAASDLLQEGSHIRVMDTEDCDGMTDALREGAVTDRDGDGHTADSSTWKTVTGDCNDEDPTIYEGAAEKCGDLIDQDCDGKADEGTVNVDQDGDGITTCDGDCDDTDPTVGACH